MKMDLLDKAGKYMMMGGMALAMLFCLTACGDNKYDENENASPTESVSPTESALPGNDSDLDESAQEDKSEDGMTKTYEKSYEVEDNGDGKFESSIRLSGDEVEEIEEGSD